MHKTKYGSLSCLPLIGLVVDDGASLMQKKNCKGKTFFVNYFFERQNKIVFDSKKKNSLCLSDNNEGLA